MRNFCIALMAICLAAIPAAAADRALDFLKYEPVTLLDWGLIRLQNDLDQAANDDYGLMAGTESRSGAYFDVRHDRIIAYVTLATRYDLRTENNCRAAFGQIADKLTFGAPSGADKAGWYLQSIFSHVGQRSAKRPHNLPQQLTDLVNLEVALRAREHEHKAGDWLRVSCAGRLDDRGEAIDVAKNGAIQ